MTVTNTVPPTVSGTARVGRTLSTTNGSWTFDDDYLTYTYKWLRCNSVGASCSEIVGETGSTYLITVTDVGSTLRSEVTAEEHVAAPPSGDLLKYTPPGYPSYSGYTTINVTNGNRSLSLSTSTDYIINMPASPLLGRLAINGGRNIVLIGGEIRIDSLATPGGGPEPQYGVYCIQNSAGTTRTVHIEGLYVHGAGSAGTIVFSEYNGNSTYQIQNCRLQCEHPVWHTNEGDPEEIHTDAIQSWAGPQKLLLFNNTLISTGLSFQMQPRIYRTSSIDLFSYEQVNCFQTTADAPAFNKSDSGKPWWAEYHADLYLTSNPAHSQPVMVNWHSNVAGWNPGGGTNVTGESLHLSSNPATSQPPGGDYVPLGTAGLSYTSPGYV